MENVKITTEYIKLDQFLKFVGMVSNGGEAKAIIAYGLVLVNEKVEKRRGKKLRPGDRITYGKYEYIVI